MDKPESTCINCTKRVLGCHTNCVEYAEYKEKLAIYKAWLRKTKSIKRAAEVRPWYRERVTKGRK